MADEATNMANDQLVFCLRWVDYDLLAHDEYIGLHNMKPPMLIVVLKNVLLRMNPGSSQDIFIKLSRRNFFLTFYDIRKYLQPLSPAMKSLILEVIKLVK
mgnify:CR=1 FL=1